MKLESKYFDRIRVKPEEDRLLRDRVPTCEWPGCSGLGKHPAPKGRDSEGDYHYFCVDHVRQYNKQYNYFSGMQDPEIEDWRKEAETGHRPTWRLGQNSWAAHNGGRFRSGKASPDEDLRDPFDLLKEKKGGRQPQRPSRAPRNAEMKALHTLGLDETATAEKVKLQYKTLVKRLHPDANGGSRANEDKLREIIQAYDYLRKAGYR
ncbi:MAG: J domain-containing protein [Aestuariivirgaceae bacterium]